MPDHEYILGLFFDFLRKRKYIFNVESRLKNNGATHGPEREFHEGSDGLHLVSPTPGFPVSFPNWAFLFINFYRIKCHGAAMPGAIVSQQVNACWLP
jgi:hypothetical protein